MSVLSPKDPAFKSFKPEVVSFLAIAVDLRLRQ